MFKSPTFISDKFKVTTNNRWTITLLKVVAFDDRALSTLDAFDNYNWSKSAIRKPSKNLPTERK